MPSARFVLTAGGADTTLKPLLKAATSLPVVTVTVRAPKVAAGSMLTTAMALTGELTVSDTTVIPAPKPATLVPWTKWVAKLVMATERFWEPGRVLAGDKLVRVGVPVA